tara:strand:- start:1763 stop:2029 length:267 start_codon:yes stop_codon:yes gene_type:complete
MDPLGLALAAAITVNLPGLSCRTSVEEWDEFLTEFEETRHEQGLSAAGQRYWFYFGEKTWTVVVEIAPGNVCTSPNMLGTIESEGSPA